MTTSQPQPCSRKQPLVTKARSLAFGTLLVVLASPTMGQSQNPSSPWGLRNVNWHKWDLNEWTGQDFQSVFGGHGAGYINYWLLWNLVEDDGCEPSPCAPMFDFSLQDSGLDKALSVGATPVIGFKLTHDDLMEQAGKNGSRYTKPIDMDEGDVLADPAVVLGPFNGPNHQTFGQYYGVSERLYLVSKGLAQAITDSYLDAQSHPQWTIPTNPEVCIVFHPEPWQEWPLGASPIANLNTYLLCYQTVREAFTRVVAANADPQGVPVVDFKFSHGSIPRRRLLAAAWYESGSGSGNQQKLLKKFQSLTERIPKALENLGATPQTAIGPTIDNWLTDVFRYADATPANPCIKARNRNVTDDLWIDAMASWTKEGYFDFSTYHGHGKPRWDERERTKFDALLSEGGSPLPWMITEAAFEVLDENVPTEHYWPMISPPIGGGTFNTAAQNAFLADRDHFVIHDYTRKWCRFLSQDSAGTGPGDPVPIGAHIFAFCTPIVAGNNISQADDPLYTGLTEVCGGFTAGMQQQTCSPNSIYLGGDKQALDPHPANAAYVEINTFLGIPEESETLIDNAVLTHLRYTYPAPSTKVIDVIWRKAMLDIEDPAANATLIGPAGFASAQVRSLDITGSWLISSGATTPVAVPDGAPLLRQLTLPGLSQAPVFVRWTP